MQDMRYQRIATLSVTVVQSTYPKSKWGTAMKAPVLPFLMFMSLSLLAGCPSSSSISDNFGFTALFFSADDGTAGRELWKTDGTEAGTVLVKDINPGVLSSSPRGFTPLNGAHYFFADQGTPGFELWKTDGTDAGTMLVKDIGVSDPFGFTLLNSSLYFVADDGTTGFELWKTDGTDTGTMLVKDINPAGDGIGEENPTPFSGAIYFGADDGTTGIELWKSDGTPAGTQLLKDINPTVGSDPANFFIFQNKLFFSADDGTNGNEMWVSDGTANGTQLFKDLNLQGSAFPVNFIELNGKLIFAAREGISASFKLWSSDGTAGGTSVLADIAPACEVIVGGFTRVGTTLFFNAFLAGGSINGCTGAQLWKTDGTQAGTEFVADFGNPLASALQLTAYNGNLYFTLATEQIWRSDGTTSGTTLLKDTNPTGSDSISNLTVFNGFLYFRADDGVNGIELWRTDGTVGGTVLFKDINPGVLGSEPNVF